MISFIFYHIVNMSITASVTGIIVLLLRKINKIPRSVISFLWLIPSVRMISPFGINSKISLFTPVFLFTEDMMRNTRSGPTSIILTSQDYISRSPGIISSHLSVYSEETFKYFNYLSLVWLSVSAVMLILLMISYFSAVISFRDARELSPGICTSDKTDSPVLMGMIFPKIILPCEYSQKNTEYIIMHEKMHIKRKDNIKRMILLVLSCIYWFNPLILIMIRKALSDIEFACDEAVLKQCGEERKKEYASTILEAAETKKLILSSFGGFRTKKRIKFILSYRKTTGLSAVFFIILIFFFTYILLTNAAVIENHFII